MSVKRALVSCICPTFNRVPDHLWLLEEAVYSFLRQDYPAKELIVLNDCPTQELICDAPNVAIVNVSRRFRSMGEKLNAAVGVAQGDLIAPWDDDDISLPWRISDSVAALGEMDYYNPMRYWLSDSKGLRLQHPISLVHACSLFTRRAFDAVGGYPHLTGNQDLVLHRRFKQSERVQVSPRPELAPSEWYYIYRWGVSPAHLSWRRPYDAWYEEIGRRAAEPGQFVLCPHWRKDYVALTRQALREAGNAPPELGARHPVS